MEDDRMKFLRAKVKAALAAIADGEIFDGDSPNEIFIAIDNVDLAITIEPM